MILYKRYEAPPELRLRYHFRDRFGKDIEGAREYDPVTGEGKREIGNTGVMIDFFSPQGYVEMDGHVNPSKEVLNALFQNSMVVISSPAALDKIARKVSEDVRFEKGFKENNPTAETR